MKALTYQITSLSPLLITSNTGDPNMVSTKEYISGTSILGCLAGMYIRKNNLADAQKDNNFYHWFLNGGIRFTNAYIVSYDDKNNIADNSPIPISIQRDKDDEQDIYNLLHDKVEKPTKIIGGFGKIDNNFIYEQKIKKSLNFHHERDPDTGTTKEGMIFNYESIDAGQIFKGTVIGEEGEVKNLVSSIGNNFETRIGRSRSAQYGRIRFEFISDNMEDIPVQTTTGTISLSLLSDTIIYNEEGCSTTDVKSFKKTLEAKLGSSVTIERTFIKAGEIENFVSVWKLRKPSETCLLMGSCFMISGIDAPAADKLKELQITGLGERTHEGFGRVAIGMPTDIKLAKREYEEVPYIPKILPSMAKRIAEDAIKNYVQKTIEVDALTDCAVFQNLPSKSLISRLEAASKTNNVAAFGAYLNALRNTAKDKLNKCNNRKETLFAFLINKHINIDKIVGMPPLDGICKLVSPAFGEEFMQSLHRLYLGIFFSDMRKRKKKEVN